MNYILILMQIIAHRGASALEPENTLRSISRAIELGTDLLEVDVRQSRDG
jgi:glycerophosphoryl diester phosphodiesterase